jgi:hypothetical protein
MARAAITGEAILPVMSRAECAAWVSRLDLAPPMSPA